MFWGGKIIIRSQDPKGTLKQFHIAYWLRVRIVELFKQMDNSSLGQEIDKIVLEHPVIPGKQGSYQRLTRS